MSKWYKKFKESFKDPKEFDRLCDIYIKLVFLKKETKGGER